MTLTLRQINNDYKFSEHKTGITTITKEITMSETQISEKLPKIQIQTDRGNITIEMFEDEAPTR